MKKLFIGSCTRLPQRSLGTSSSGQVNELCSGRRKVEDSRDSSGKIADDRNKKNKSF